MRRGDPGEPSSASEGDKENERPAQRCAPTSAHTQLTYLSDPLKTGAALLQRLVRLPKRQSSWESKPL